MATSLTRQNNFSSVTEALYGYEEQRTPYRMNHLFPGKRDEKALELKLDFYKNLLKAYRKTHNPQDRQAIRYVRLQVLLLGARLRPSFLGLLRLFLLVAGRILTRNLRQHVRFHRDIKRFERQQVMHHNVNGLQQSLKSLGFNMNMEGPLQKMMQHNLAAFHIHYFEPRYDKTDFVLHFSKVPGTDRYMVSHVDASSRQKDPYNQGAYNTATEHRFSLQDGLNAGQISALVQNKRIAVQVDGQESWVGLRDLKSAEGLKTPVISFDLRSALEKWPIKELTDPGQRKKLMESLRSGHPSQVTIDLPNGPEKLTVAIPATSNTISFSDKQGKPVDMDTLIRGERFINSKKIIQQSRQRTLRKGLHRV